MTSHDFRPNHERHPWKLILALLILALIAAACSSCHSPQPAALILSHDDLLIVTPDTTRPHLYPAVKTTGKSTGS